MKTPEEIKKSLKCHITLHADCSDCAYGYDTYPDGGCIIDMIDDALAYINAMEKRIEEHAEAVKVTGCCPNCGTKMEAGGGTRK